MATTASLYLPDPEESRIKRGQRMAALLQQQAQAPVEAQSYGGIPAPISPLNGLAKALAGFGSAYVERDSEKRERDLGEKYRTEAQDWAKALQGTMQPGSPAPTAQPADIADREQGMQMGSGAQPLAMGQQIGPAGASTMVPPSNDFLRQTAVQGMTSGNPLIRGIAPSVFETAEKRDATAAALQAKREDTQAARAESERLIRLKEDLRSQRPPTSGQFGNSLQGRAHDILLAPDADPSSPTYRAAYAVLAAPQMTFDSTSGQMIQRQPDMSAYKPPTAAAPAAAGVPAPAAPAAPGQPTLTTQQVTPSREQPFSATQALSAGFADRMSGAHSVLADPQIAMQGADLQGRMLENMPGGLGNYGQSPRYQQFKQARDNFINAQLRRESGAAISPAEYASADKQYFPVPGDKPEVIKQKAANRQQVIDAMIREAGPKYTAPSSAPGVPNGVDPKVWSAMTPQEQALWK